MVCTGGFYLTTHQGLGYSLQSEANPCRAVVSEEEVALAFHPEHLLGVPVTYLWRSPCGLNRLGAGGKGWWWGSLGAGLVFICLFVYVCF